MFFCTTYHKINDVPQDWNSLLNEEDFFLSKPYLKIIEEHHRNEISPLYTLVKNETEVLGIIYAQKFNFQNSKLKNYIRQESSLFDLKTRLITQIGKFINVNVCFLGNLFLSNESAFKLSSKFQLSPSELELILRDIQEVSDTKAILISDSYEDIVDVKNAKIRKISVESDMHLAINKDWSTFEDYIASLSSKYRKKYRATEYKSRVISKKKLDLNELKSLSKDLKKLFDQVYTRSTFSSSKFNTDTFQSLVTLTDQVCIYGYYVDKQLIGFSSLIKNKKTLYAYFIGIDYKTHIEYELYSKMLYDKIAYAIDSRLDLIKFGRTANEFKSNFGAVQQSGDGYIFEKSGWILFLISPFLKLLQPKPWIPRNPFKNQKGKEKLLSTNEEHSKKA